MNRREFLHKSGFLGGFLLAETPFLLPKLADWQPLARVERVYIAMGTTVRFIVFHEDEREAVAAIHHAHAVVQKIHGLMSIQESGSELARWNRSNDGLSVEFHPLTAASIDHAVSHAESTGGRFDPTVGAAVEAARSGRIPIPQNDRMGVWNAEERRLGKVHPSICLDLGGSAKGWAVDRAVDVLTSRGISAALVNAGGDLRVVGHPPDGDAWRIGIRDPRNPDDVLSELRLTNCAAATSGGYESEGSIIVDPRDARPVRFEGSATVIAPTCGTADCLSTALCVDPEASILPNDAHSLIARIVNGALLVSPSQNFHHKLSAGPLSEGRPDSVAN